MDFLQERKYSLIEVIIPFTSEDLLDMLWSQVLGNYVYG